MKTRRKSQPWKPEDARVALSTMKLAIPKGLLRARRSGRMGSRRATKAIRQDSPIYVEVAGVKYVGIITNPSTLDGRVGFHLYTPLPDTHSVAGSAYAKMKILRSFKEFHEQLRTKRARVYLE